MSISCHESWYLRGRYYSCSPLDGFLCHKEPKMRSSYIFVSWNMVLHEWIERPAKSEDLTLMWEQYCKKPEYLIFGRISNVQKRNHACVTYDLGHQVVYCVQREANIWINNAISLVISWNILHRVDFFLYFISIYIDINYWYMLLVAFIT